jgi:hypothetical protein
MRSTPYLGTQTDKTVLQYAYDAMVFINEEYEIPVCFECNAKVPIKKYITSISTSLSIEGSGGGNASFEMIVPAHDTTFIRNGKPILAPMMEVEIWFKGAFTVYGMPRYYRAFWGYINTISYSYSDGSHSMSVSCNDMLSYWNLIKFSANPSLEGSTISGTQDTTVWQTRFKNTNPFQILLQLTLVTRIDLVEARSLNNEALQSEDAREAWRTSADQMMAYWRQRLNKIARAIRVYGVQGESIFDSARFYSGDRAAQKLMSQELQHISPQRIIGLNLTTHDQQFNPFLSFSNIDLFDSDHRGRLDVMVSVKDHIGWEFYLDTTGEIVFKPPYYNIDVRQNYPISWIRDIDVYSWGFDEGEPEATRVDAFGHLLESIRGSYAETCEVNGTFQNPHLVRQFGVRTESVQAHWLKTGAACSLFAANRMSQHDANRYTGNVTISGRPELRLGMPIYIESMDCFYYVSSINHSFAYGSSYTTSLGLRAKRERFHSTELATRNGTSVSGVQIQLDANGVNRNDIGQDIGIPNVVMRTASPEEFRTKFNLSDPAIIGAHNPDGDPYLPERAGGYLDHTQNPLSAQIAWDDQRRGMSQSIQGGLWAYDIDYDGVIQSLSYRPPDGQSKPDSMKMEDCSIPVSDAAGYKLVGVFPYGRGLVIDATGSVASPTGTSDSEGNPVGGDTIAASIATQAVLLRNMTPDDMVEVTVGQNTRDTIGGGTLSGASVLKIDQTNSGEQMATLSYSDNQSTCTCLDSYRIGNLLLLQNLEGAFNDVFDNITNLDQLLDNSYQVDAIQSMQHETDLLRVKTGETIGVVSSLQDMGAPKSPTLNT